jgi:carbon monoxide dehydrogenase subunit G
MTRIESDVVTLAKPAKEVFEFLCDFKNIGTLMPEQVENFVTDGPICHFDIKGMASMGLAYGEKTPDSKIVMLKNGKAPFDFSLVCEMTAVSESSTKLQLFFDADLNPLFKMMAEKPLTNFLNLLVHRYEQLSA